MAIATQAVQLHGGYGYTREFPVERHFRDAETILVIAGTPAMERRTIGATVVAEAGR
jgi:alkylation response protein AidB-like acyl-CoA dehydrogenase